MAAFFQAELFLPTVLQFLLPDIRPNRLLVATPPWTRSSSGLRSATQLRGRPANSRRCGSPTVTPVLILVRSQWRWSSTIARYDAEERPDDERQNLSSIGFTRYAHPSFRASVS